MISDFSKKKGRDKNRTSRKAHGPDAHKKGATQDPDVDLDFSGIELGEYARDEGMTEHEVWTKIRSGELIGRSFNGKLYIHEPESDTAEELDRLQMSGELPPLPVDEDDVKPTSSAGSRMLPQEAQAPEIALLLDHLSLSKEENKEILKLTQDSITRITQMTDTIVALKDELLRTRDDQIDTLKEKMRSKDMEIAQLKQELEDLRMLAAAMDSDSNP